MVRDLAEEIRPGEAHQLGLGARQGERSQGARALPRERHAPLRRQRFRQHEPAEGRVQQAGRRRHPERQAGIEAAQQAADRGSQHEAQAERHADDAEGLGPAGRWRHVGDIGERRGDGGGRDAGDDPAHEQQDERGRERHEDIVQAKPQAGQQDHRPPPEAIAERAQQGRTHELHGAPHGGEQAEHFGGAGDVAVHEAQHDPGQHGNHHAQRQNVERHGAEYEGERTPRVHREGNIGRGRKLVGATGFEPATPSPPD